MISTGKADWEREVTEVNGSLAALVHTMFSKSTMKPADFVAKKLQHSVPGVLNRGEGARILILNGSHPTISEHHNRETVLIFPDYRVVFGVENMPKAAELLYTVDVMCVLDDR